MRTDPLPWHANPRRAAAIIFLGVLLLYHANGRSHAGCDTIAAPYTAWALVRHGSWDVSAYRDLDKFRPDHVRVQTDGTAVTTRPGPALFCIPVVAPVALFRERPLSQTNMNHLGKLAAALWAAGSAVLFFLLVRRIVPSAKVGSRFPTSPGVATPGPGSPETAAWLATILFAFGTSMFSIAGMSIWMHGPAAFCLTVALSLLLAEPEGPGWRAGLGAGLALGLAIFIRATTGLFTAAAVAGLMFAWRRSGRWQPLAALVAGLVPPLVGLWLYNSAYMGHALLGGYVTDDWETKTPFWLGFAGLLVAPSRGLLVYTPAFLLVPLGLWAVCRGAVGTYRRDMILLWLGAVAATVLFYSRWCVWWGGWCFGPRFLCECLPVLCLLFALAVARLRRVPWRCATLLVGLSVLVHAAGVFGHNDAWNARHEDNWPVVTRRMFELHDTQIEASLRHMLHLDVYPP